MQGVLVPGQAAPVRESEGGGDPAGQRLGVVGRGVALLPRVGQQLTVGPEGLTVGPPQHTDLPSGQRLARVPLALSVMQDAARREAVEQPAGERLGPYPLVLSVSSGGPLRAFHVVDRHEGRLASLGEADVAAHQSGVDGVAECVDPRPLTVAVRERDAGRLMDATYCVGELEGHLAGAGGAGDRSCARRLRRTGQGNVTLAGPQPGGGVEADPAGARHEDLRPCMEIREVGNRSGRAFDRGFVGSQLHQVARHEPGREPEMAQDLDEQPGAVPAGTECLLQGLVGSLDARLHAGRVDHRRAHPLVQLNEEIDDGRAAFAGRRLTREPFGQQRTGLPDLQVGSEVERHRGVVGEGVALGRLLHEEVERVHDRQVGNEVDGEGELAARRREHQTSRVIAERVLLPVDEMVTRLDRQRVGEDRRTTVGGRSEPHDVREERHRPVESIRHGVLEGDPDAHTAGRGPTIVTTID